LFIAQSAFEFLAKLHPAFKFEQTVQIPDYPPEKTDVWGYGADAPTAGRIVDESLRWMKTQKKRRFFAWLFHFDQHNWRELDTEYVHVAAKKYTVPDSGEHNWRYRVVARAIDAEFQRLLRGLSEAGLAENTVVLFVSDHGEALGRDGFWVHSVFLWESLVRVPLILRVPRIPPRQVDDRVSLVDVAPTLARYIQRNAPMAGYHGEDLLSYATPKRPARRLPILMAAASKDQLARVGLIPPDQSHKLVFSFESGLPELYDLRSQDPDLTSVAEQDPALTLRMLSMLARSPVFPRTITDLRTREALSITTGGQ
jgi:phosphoglycerol transferase MdoB-like AlkP superfamily enzyme